MDRLIRYGYRLFIVLCFTFIFAPILALVVFAFNDNRFPSLPWKGFTLKWFSQIIHDSSISAAALNSLLVALCTAVIATVLGGAAAYCVTRWEFKGKSAYLGIVAAPPCIPLIILGLALLMYFKQIGLSGSLLAVIISHAVLASPFALGIVRMRLAEMDPNIEQAAWNLGANEWSAIRTIILPQAGPAFVAAFLLSMTVSWDEFIISWFVSGFNETLPVHIWNTFSAHVSAEVNAIGTVAFVLSIALVIVAQLLFFRYGRRGRRSPSFEEGEGNA